MGKPAIKSVTIVAVVIGILASLAPLTGHVISASDQGYLVALVEDSYQAISTLVAVVSGIVAIWGRFRATQPVTGIIKTTDEVTP